MSDKASIEKKYGVVITPPVETPTGISVLLPGTLLDLKDYNSTRDVLLSKNQLVIGFKKLIPVVNSHTKMAEDVVAVVKAVRALSAYASLPESKYNIVGHSLGGKVSLMVAAKYKDDVGVIIAMDPVDDMPQELTYPKASPKTNLTGTTAKIHLLESEFGGRFPAQAPKGKNATAIKETYPALFSVDSGNSFFVNPGAIHMSYKDTEHDEASIAARESAHELIREHIGA